MGEKIEKGEEDRERFLHAQEAVKGPFAMELNNFFRCCNALVGYDMLAGIVAFCWAVPEEELVEKSWVVLDMQLGSRSLHTD